MSDMTDLREHGEPRTAADELMDAIRDEENCRGQLAVAFPDHAERILYGGFRVLPGHGHPPGYLDYLERCTP
jgi:hypothetical protein